MKTEIIITLVAAFLGAAGVVEYAGLPRAKATVHVLNEDGQPIPGANATFGFCAQFNFETNIKVEGVTDANGNFTGEGYSNGMVGNEIRKEGYYLGWAPLPTFYTSNDGHWQPWDQTYTTVLRRIETQISLYVRKWGAKIPAALNESCGFDLEAADWVAPYGKGKAADFIVTVTYLKYTDYNNNELTASITFPNDGDGIQEVKLPKEFANSQFKWPREAPEAGYLAKLEAHHIWSMSPLGTNITDTSKGVDGYFFRVRTVKQGSQITSALYGKITGGIGVGPNEGKNGYISFTYYLNPTSLDRNLEFSGNTLFKNLALSETTHVP